MTTPSSVPSTVLPPQVEQTVTPEVVKTATRIVRTKSFLSKQLKTTVPAFAAGVLTTTVYAVRSARKHDSDLDIDTVDDSTE